MSHHTRTPCQVTKGGKQVKERSRQISKDLRGRLKDLQVPQARGEDTGAPWMNGQYQRNTVHDVSIIVKHLASDSSILCCMILYMF